MSNFFNKLFGFRSKTGWKMILASIYYCLVLFYLFLIFKTKTLIKASGFDNFIYYCSAITIFLWLISPAIFLSDTKIRNSLPLLNEHIASKTLLAMMIISVLFMFLFATFESYHSKTYQQAFEEYIRDSNETFYKAGID